MLGTFSSRAGTSLVATLTLRGTEIPSVLSMSHSNENSTALISGVWGTRMREGRGESETVQPGVAGGAQEARIDSPDSERYQGLDIIKTARCVILGRLPALSEPLLLL